MANFQIVYTMLKTRKWSGESLLDAKVGVTALHELGARADDLNNRKYGSFSIQNEAACLPANFHARRSAWSASEELRQNPLCAGDMEVVQSGKYTPWRPAHMSYHHILIRPSQHLRKDIELAVHRLLEQRKFGVCNAAQMDGDQLQRCRELFRVPAEQLRLALAEVRQMFPNDCIYHEPA